MRSYVIYGGGFRSSSPYGTWFFPVRDYLCALVLPTTGLSGINVTQTAGAISDLIAVPKGGGAQKGLGEKFSADLHTGTGNFSVPIALPPGRNGLQPQLSLGFSTGSGNSPFGLGWALSVPAVSRLTSKGIPRYRDGFANEQDTFVLSGAEDLVEVESSVADGEAGVKIYRPRTEGLFAQIAHHTRDTDHWQVRTKDGLASRAVLRLLKLTVSKMLIGPLALNNSADGNGSLGRHSVPRI